MNVANKLDSEENMFLREARVLGSSKKVETHRR